MNKSAKLPTSDYAKRLAAVMHRKHSTAWMPKEIRVFRLIAPTIQESDLRNVERRYRTLWPPNTGKNSLRHDLYTLLNNWSPETDRANAWCEQHPEKVIRKVIPLPPVKTEPFQPLTDPEEIAAVQRFEAFRKAKKEMGR